MEVITFVKGKISDSKMKKFIEDYESLKKESKPNGLIASYLLQDTEIKNLFIIETVWESQEALEKMRKNEEPAAPTLFKKNGSKPVLGIYNVINTMKG